MIRGWRSPTAISPRQPPSSLSRNHGHRTAESWRSTEPDVRGDGGGVGRQRVGHARVPRSLGVRPAWLIALGAVGGVVAFQLWIDPATPPGFIRYEASFSFNAYAIAQDLHDQNGALLPLYLPSFGDYKSTPFVYLLAAVFRIVAGRWSDLSGSRIVPLRRVVLAVAAGVVATAGLANGPVWMLEPALALAGALSMGWNGLAFTAATEFAGEGRSGAAIGLQQARFLTK